MQIVPLNLRGRLNVYIINSIITKLHNYINVFVINIKSYNVTGTVTTATTKL